MKLAILLALICISTAVDYTGYDWPLADYEDDKDSNGEGQFDHWEIENFFDDDYKGLPVEDNKEPQYDEALHEDVPESHDENIVPPSRVLAEVES